MPSQSKNRTFTPRSVAFLGLLTALAVIMGYVEFRIPFHFFVPGVKLGLCNIVLILVLYLYGYSAAMIVSVIRILLIGILFGNPVSMIYGLSGTFLSLTGMEFLRRARRFSVIGVSAAGAACHHIGQLFAAAALTGSLGVFRYLAVLLLMGELTGFLIGALDQVILKRIGTMKPDT